MSRVTILSPQGMLGYGVNESSVELSFEQFDINVVAVDAGSVDPGPNYLGQGKFFADETIVRRDLGILIDVARREDVPFIIGSAGGGGSQVQVNRVAKIITEIGTEINETFSMAKIYTDVNRDYLNEKIQSGGVQGLNWSKELSTEDVENASRIVAQVGVEPFIDALGEDADIIVGGRCSDLSPFSALPLKQGFDPGLTYHMSKILECGSRATSRGSGDDCLIGHMYDDRFEVVPSNPDVRCTEQSVAAHTLYEKANPNTITCSAGAVDVSAAEFKQVTDRKVRVTGSQFTRDDSNSTLLEGVECVGYRTITPAGIRDNYLIERIEHLTEMVKERVAEVSDIPNENYELSIRKYGYDAVPLTNAKAMQDPANEEREKQTDHPKINPNTNSIQELGIIIDVVGTTQEVANTICGLCRSSLLHYPLEGRINTGGNLAFPYSPSDIPVGEVYNFSIYHLIKKTDPKELYQLKMEEI